MNKFIAADASRCIGCHTCEVACAVTHSNTGNVDGLTPANFAPRLYVIKTASISEPATCRQCEDAPCLNSCPTAAIHYAQQSVQVNQDLCIGCKSCEVACPFGVMDVVSFFSARTFAGSKIANRIKAEAHKCDLCIAENRSPACVDVCPTDALRVMEHDNINEMRQQRRLISTAGLGKTA